MDLFETIEKRASVRALKAAAIPDSDLARILEAGRRAPSGSNRQPLDFIVIRDRATLAKLAESQACIADVSVAIAVVADPEKSEWWVEDVAAATENMLLAITALGYASVWIEGTLRRAEEQHKQTLGLPPNLRLVVVLPIGAPAQEVKQAKKRDLGDMVHYERYGNRHV
jgi:nitroreductase